MNNNSQLFKVQQIGSTKIKYPGARGGAGLKKRKTDGINN